MPALIGDSVTADIRFRSQTTTAPSTISKTGRLTIPISGTRHGIISAIPRISLQRRLVRKFSIHHSDYCRQCLTPRNPQMTITDIYSTSTIPYDSKRIHGRVQMFSSCRKL